MNEVLAPSSSIAADLALVLLHFIWQGALIAAVVWMLLRIGPQARPSTRYLIALLGGVLCALAPMATLFHLRFSAAVDPINQPIVMDMAAAPLNEGAVRTEVSVDGVAAVSTLPAWQFGLVVAWSLGVLLMAGRLLFGWMTVLRLRKHTVAAPPDLLDRVAGYAVRLRLRRMPQIAVSSRIAEAMVVGMLRPMILLPAAWLTDLPPDILSAVLAHELAHVRRLDPWVNTVQRMVETLLFYHPSVWWLSRRIRLEREFCCDELAVRITGQPLVYARTLEMVAHRRVRGRVPALATGIGDGKMALLKRVQHVLGGGGEDRPRGPLTPLAAALLVLFAFAVYRTALYMPASLLADDEVRRGRDGERARRGGDEDRETDRGGRRSDVRRGERDDDREEHERHHHDGEGEQRRHDDDREESIRLPEDMSPEVRELIGDLLSQIEELRHRLGEGGAEVQLHVEVHDLDEVGSPDDLDRRHTSRRERADDDEVESEDESASVEIHGFVIGEEDGEPRVRSLRDGEFGWRLFEEEEEEVESGRSGAGGGEEEGDESGERRVRFWRFRSEHDENEEIPARIMRFEPRLIEQPELREGLEAEVQQLRRQVSDLAEVVGDLRDVLRERDDDSDEEREVYEGRRELLLDRIRNQETESEESGRESEQRFGGAAEADAAADGGVQQRMRFEFRRELERRSREDEVERQSEEEDAGGGEAAGRESTRSDAGEARHYTLRSTGDGRVRVSVRGLDGEESVLEGQVIEISDDLIHLQDADPIAGGGTGEEAGPFAD